MSYMNCPRCRLGLENRGDHPAHEICPRWLGRSFSEGWNLAADLRARRAGRRLELVCTQGQLRRLLELTGAGRQLAVCDPPRHWSSHSLKPSSRSASG